MHTGNSYKVAEFLVWTRRDIYLLVVLGTAPVLAYEIADLDWLGIPWTVVALLGTATAFIVGFKNVQTYNRTWEARQIWGDILSGSKAWGVISRDFITNPSRSRELVHRHFAWLTALRYQMRVPRSWEAASRPNNSEYSRRYSVPEREVALEAELAKYLSADELTRVLEAHNRAAQLLGLQSSAVKGLYADEDIVVLQFVEMERVIREFFVLQGRSERIKDFPYPRQFATINRLFVRLFCVLLPFGLLREFDSLNEQVDGPLQGRMVWFVIPFSVLISWLYTSLEQVGASTESPFEGGPNDVPISQLCRATEIDMRQMLGETDLPSALTAENNILL
jgi:ion channel-forming bestrophin family protein